jgi:hypothetical protein
VLNGLARRLLVRACRRWHYLNMGRIVFAQASLADTVLPSAAWGAWVVASPLVRWRVLLSMYVKFRTLWAGRYFTDCRLGSVPLGALGCSLFALGALLIHVFSS